ncbi:Dihydroxy-acid dehydratase [Planctomycetes bacterium Pan216]|uniref:Dihydroxy-acid dehydratase n=1 Tax=Kolteria novifilia TaxID=2527975 RepID=A0A518AWU9_9BACT|nr:Dihydroxy-acid dehydratase [Planctomycetes bacterium Pan216]
MSQRLNWNSHELTAGWQQGTKAFYYGLGLEDKDLAQPQVGIGVPLLDGNLCNQHAYELAGKIAEGCRDVGMLGFPFGVPAVSDNISQGHEGGNASLPSRNMIASGAEAVVSAHRYDALVGLHHCDKNGPGFAMALARLNVPGLIVGGGTIMPGSHHGRPVTILDVYDSQAAAGVGAISREEADQILRVACPGPGGCGIAASFNTWGIVLEALGLMLPESSSIPAIADVKRDECQRAGSAVRRLLEQGTRPRDILTERAFRNAARALAAAGGSTNGILHLLALAREAGVAFGLREIQAIMRQTPVLCDFAPRGKGTMVDLHELGGTPVLLKHLLDGGFLDGDALTVTGKTLAENLADARPLATEQQLIAPLDAPLKPHADIQICFGNLAPDGIVFKVSSLKETHFRGKAVCFEDPRAIVEAVNVGKIQPGSVIVLRQMGPVATGMPEVLVATAALATPTLEGKVAFVSDTRVSGVSHGAIGVHCSPEAAVGGPIALLQDGDPISFDLLEGTITVHISDDELAARRGAWQPPALRYPRGYLAEFASTVTQASEGCVPKAILDGSVIRTQ